MPTDLETTLLQKVHTLEMKLQQAEAERHYCAACGHPVLPNEFGHRCQSELEAHIKELKETNAAYADRIWAMRSAD